MKKAKSSKAPEKPKSLPSKLSSYPQQELKKGKSGSGFSNASLLSKDFSTSLRAVETLKDEYSMIQNNNTAENDLEESVSGLHASSVKNPLGTSVTFGPLHDFLQDQEIFPIKHVQTFIQGLHPENYNILDFTGCTQVTDCVFFAMLELLPSCEANLKSVSAVRLGGCHFMTDKGVECIAHLFPSLKKLILDGCPYITEASLAVVAECCQNLDTLQISGTNTVVLPRMLSHVLLVNTCCPFASPMATEMIDTPAAAKDIMKACIVHKEMQTAVSILNILHEDKDLAFTFPVSYKPSISCGMNLQLNVIECDEITLDLFMGPGWAVYIIPVELTETTNIEKEATWVLSIMISILCKTSSGAFVLLGLSSDQTSVISVDSVKDKVDLLVASFLSFQQRQRTVNAEPKIMAEQLRLDQMERNIRCCKKLQLTALKINMNQKEKAGSILKEHLTAVCARNPEASSLCPMLCDFLSGAFEQDATDLSTGMYTLNSAAERLLPGTQFTSVLEAQGAILFLTKVGKLTSWKQPNGSDMYISTSLMCNILNQLVSAKHDADINNAMVPLVSDSTPVLSESNMKDIAAKSNADIAVVQNVVNDMAIYSHGRVIPLSYLQENPEISLDSFSTAKDDTDCLKVTYNFLLPTFVPICLWMKLVARLVTVHRPLHVWRHGIIIQDGIVELLVTCTGDAITIVAQTIKVENSKVQEVTPQCVMLLWDCIELYRVITEHIIRMTGLSPEIRLIADHPCPDKATGIHHGHRFKDGDSFCLTCGQNSSKLEYLQIVDSDLNPPVITKERVSFRKGSKQGSVQGSQVTLFPGVVANILSALTGMGIRSCSILLMGGNLQCLQMKLSCAGNSHLIPFSGKQTLSLTRKHSANGQAPTEISKMEPGVMVNIRLQQSSESKQECVVDCRGVVLAQETLPSGNCRLDLQMVQPEDSADALSPDDYVQFSVLSRSFGTREATLELHVGMRLEAVDRLNPHLICVATIADIQQEREGHGGQLLIHFDGWSSRYDYWAEYDSPDLHPIGFMAEVGFQIPDIRGQIQPPKDYNQVEFDWATYLQEVSAEPVPYDFFTNNQTAGTSPDKYYDVCLILGIDVRFKSGHQACSGNLTQNGVLEGLVKLMTSQSSTQTHSFVKNNHRLFCLLPSNFDLHTLRYPSLKSLFRPKTQKLHVLCPGQDNQHHLMNFEGLNCASVVKTYMGLENFLCHVYLLLLAQEKTLPSICNNLCKGSEEVSPEQKHRLELGFKRVYHLYLMIFIFLGGKSLLQSTEEESKGPQLEGQHALDLKRLLQEAYQKNATFAQLFSHDPEFTRLECKVHEAAHSVGLDLATFPMETFQGMSEDISNLSIANNKVDHLPSTFGSSFPNLVHLNLSCNRLAALPPMDEIKNLVVFDISNNCLTSVDLPSHWNRSLQELIISHNPLHKLPSSLDTMASLTKLLADNIGSLDSMDSICSLKKLNILSLNYNVITSLPSGIKDLPLTVLNLAAVPLIKPLPSSVAAYSLEAFIAFCHQWTATSHMLDEELKAIFTLVDKSSTKQVGRDQIGFLNEQLMMCLPRLGQTAQSIGTVFPTPLLEISGLNKLDLSYQGIVTVPDDIKAMKNLQILVLTGCQMLESLSPELVNLPLKELNLHDCLLLKTPPKEIVRRGFSAVYGYLRRLLMGSSPCKRTKLMMVGLGGAGKTSLVRALTLENFRINYDYNEMITDGIDISKWNVTVQGEREPLQYSVWDFAGQTVYYNTHQFFLSNRAVYLLLWNVRLGYEHAGLDFWLSSIACHAPKAPVLVVGTHCDKVEKSVIPSAELKQKFPQITGFHFVSSYTGDGLPKLREDLIAVTLTQKYMGEMIPEAWLNLETALMNLRTMQGKKLLPWTEVEKQANGCGIFDAVEITQAVQFLHDLGSVQFFNTEFLRSNVVIDPQWIVDVMACVVTVHTGPVKEGVLHHKDMAEVWSEYPAELHPWLLRLTEEFDLTFPLPETEANIVPCLLPDVAPQYEWPEPQREKGERETKMIYKFFYLPVGLFNRAQARLHTFADSVVMWKKGFLLKKNQHQALMLQISNTEVQVTAQGFKPENMLFLVHEVFECLISESYSGVTYDFLIPCMECQAQNQVDLCMFPASKVQRAIEHKAPFLQCDRAFHIISLPEIQAVMPPDRNSDFDEHLRRGVRELHTLQEDLSISIFFCYSKKNVPLLEEEGKVVHPGNVIEDLRATGYKVSFTDQPETDNMETLTLSMKSSQVVIFGISDEFVSNEQCHNLIIYAKETLHKPILLITLGKTSNWLKQNISIVLGDEVYVKMQDLTRYSVKIKELTEAVKTKAGIKKMQAYPQCFISYCWANSLTAVQTGSSSTSKALGWGDPRKLKKFLEDNGVTCWIDTEQMGQEGFFEDIAEGLRKANVMIACVSNEYAESRNCRMEFRFGLSTLRIPIILAVVGTGYQWERSQVGMIAVGQDCPKVNLQYENRAGLLDVLALVKKALPAENDGHAEVTPLGQRQIAFQEVLELTQRKFLRQLTSYMSASDMHDFPRLVLVDLVDKSRDEQVVSSGDDTIKTLHDGGGECEQEKGEQEKQEMKQKLSTSVATQVYCCRLLCEWELGWHETSSCLPLSVDHVTGADMLSEVAPYCARILAILKHTSLSLPILTSPAGELLCKKFEEWGSSRGSSEFQEEYKKILELAIELDVNKTYGGLFRCQMTSGKQLWLCSEHRQLVSRPLDERATSSTHTTATNEVVDDNEATSASTPSSDAFPESRENQTTADASGSEEPQTTSPVPENQTPVRQVPRPLLRRATSRACRLM
ncbi:uncharacterized protein LOC112557488 isoform X2 [Pomacea canaliculata]|uniref:uncharacterized protein LOC112557488 isoform X2 n=1 Tax=Pomacea canaliculata TaxID=400727 RepID=UPI000D738B50|nr:uncharacterized protein LOC112557488 isoform X2 [Pomacea canaliculata]